MTAAPYPQMDDRAPCRHGDPDRFHQPGCPPPELLDECRGCPFVEPCLAYALVHDVSGVWGGTTTAERRRMRKARGIVAKPVQFGLVKVATEEERLERRRETWRDANERRRAAGA